MTSKRLALLGAALAAGLWLYFPGEFVEVSIPPSSSASETAALLRRKGVIRFELPFRLAAKLTGADRRLKPGIYRLRRHMASLQVLRALESGASQGVKVVIPEGFAARQIAERLGADGVCKGADFMKFVAARRLEGYLFPTTYYFEPGTGAEKAVRRMYQEFKRKIEPEYEAADPKPGLTLNQVVTLASIVEREAVLNREKPMIAAVYLNRMRKRMRLEADPTVQYSLGRWKQDLSSADIRNASPYNTYVHYGLPPGPICSPGLDSIRAALSPAGTDALYFVADNKGGHIFTATHEEHLKAKQSFKKGLRAIKAKLKREEQERRAQGGK